MKVKIIIQARMNSTRLPGKVLLEVMGKAVLEHLLERVKKAKSAEDVIVATTDRKEDIHIANLAHRLKVNTFRGSEDDVLDRFYQAAKAFGAGHIIRITGDCPLIDHQVIDEVVSHYFKSGADYCSNTIERTFPDGEDVEIFSLKALEYAWKNANLTSEREHVTPYITKHPEIFKSVNFKQEKDLSKKRWTLDEKRDFEFIKAVLEELYPNNPDFGTKDILEFLERRPHLESINKGIALNEGYMKSLENDNVINADKRKTLK